ncbi:MAG: hypothetical protein IPP17_14355 [Bacteroidetes bacterium]|nr:hypothetical protein [Bacteroidota bacterium]
MKPLIQIPKPCHEDWDAMALAERGRQCAVCDKVVRDFVGMELNVIQAELQHSSDKVCGRLDPENVSAEPLKELVLVKYPLERLRVFVLAFVLVFGVEVWGVSEVDAQTVQPEVEKLQSSGVLAGALQDSAKVFRISGKVEDVYTREPVMQARVSVYQGGKLIDGGWTREDGSFSIEIPKTSMVGDTFDLQLYHNGKIRWDSGIPSDLREFQYLIDAARLMDEIAIRDRSVQYIVGDLRYVTVGMIHQSVGSTRSLYRPLDEWLMMNFSEINHTGRW